MLERNTQMLFDKELDTLSRGFVRRNFPQRPAAIGMWPLRTKSSPHLNHSSTPTPTDTSFFSRSFGSSRSLQSKFGSRSELGGPNAAYFGSCQRLLPYHIDYDYSIIKERSETDSLETNDRMTKYWDVATTEL
ncbi:hypothetical protein O3M35_005407 [Rhynocoris fuscipes]|uniref:Uncharacterized protein n=1 Tax=Rhynocoris fuscipes TaxID=488301 RepID=A0AAW1DLU2_9HEMI